MKASREGLPIETSSGMDVMPNENECSDEQENLEHNEFEFSSEGEEEEEEEEDLKKLEIITDPL